MAEYPDFYFSSSYENDGAKCLYVLKGKYIHTYIHKK